MAVSIWSSRRIHTSIPASCHCGITIGWYSTWQARCHKSSVVGERDKLAVSISFLALSDLITRTKMLVLTAAIVLTVVEITRVLHPHNASAVLFSVCRQSVAVRRMVMVQPQLVSLYVQATLLRRMLLGILYIFPHAL